jgi:probable rRNA maturation factor
MSLNLVWSNELEEQIPDEWIDKLKMILHKAGDIEQVTEGEVALTFVDNDTIQELNRSYRGLDKPTDVLSFAMRDNGEEEMDITFDEDMQNSMDDELLGDIIISIPRAKEQSIEYGHSLEREIGFLFVHGFLHLIGYDHQDTGSEKAMFAKQEQILACVGLTR